jgi:DNA-binding transcriptional LysR family regulator
VKTTIRHLIFDDNHLLLGIIFPLIEIIMDRLEAMSIVVQVAETGSFSRASRQLGIPLATVSRKVNELESHLGTKLLTRTTRKVALTDAGSVYLASAKRILEEVDETERIAAGEFHQPRGELVLTAPILFGRLHILPLVTEFLALYPDIHVRLVLSDRNLHLIDDHVDVALRIGPLPDSRMVATRIGSMRTVVCASPKLLAGHGTPSDPQGLDTVPCVNFDVVSAAPAWSFRSREAKALNDVAIAPRLSVSTAEAAVLAAAQGVGVTRVLHYQCAAAVRDGSLQIILADFEPEPLPVHLIHNSRGALPSKTRAFLDFAAGRLRQRIALP